MQLDIHTYPQGQQLSDGELVQRQVIQNGRLVFTDAYFSELSDGDRYIIPIQLEMPLASDTEILDFLVKNQPKIGWTVSEFKWKGESCVHAFKRESLEDIGERSAVLGDTADLLGAFRELFTEIINDVEL